MSLFAKAKPAAQAELPLPEVSPARRAELLRRVAAHYHRAFLERPEGVSVLTKVWGLRNVELCKTFQVGLSNGSLARALPQDAETLASLKAIGILEKDGSEVWRGRLVFPLWNAQGAITSLVGLAIDSKEDTEWLEWHHMLDPQGTLWNYQAVKRSSSLLLVPSVLDALMAVDRGLTETMPIVWRSGVMEPMASFLAQCGVTAIALAGPVDWCGTPDSLEVLRQHGIAPRLIELPAEMTVASYLTGPHGEERVRALQERLSAALADRDGGSRLAVAGEVYERTARGFKLTLHGRRYDVLGFARETTQLKATIKAQGDAAKGFELHALDLYSSRSRDGYARTCASLFGVGETIIKADLARIIERIEAVATEASGASEVKAATPEETEAALRFLRNPALLDEVVADVRTLGIAGEETNIQLCYLASTSRKLEDPLSLLIQSRSAAGKSALQQAVLSLTPEEDQIHYTRLTNQALFYQEETRLAHKVLAFEEVEGLGEAAYSLRALQSAKKLTVATTAKDPVTGKMRTDHYEVQGPVAVLLTTTSASLDEETASRFLTLTIDESREMTQTILAAQRHRDTLEGYLAELGRAAIVAKHRTAQRLLEPLVIINPYAEQLEFPAESLRARRDHKKYLTLIKTVAFLRQKQRQVKTAERGDKSFNYVEVTKDDIRVANDLARRVLVHSLDELSAPARKLLVKIEAMVKAHCAEHGVAPSDFAFSRRAIREATGYTVHQVRVHAKELEDLEYLRAKAGSRGKEFIYELGALARGQGGLVLADPDRLEDPQ
jgi:hypothetical protein